MISMDTAIHPNAAIDPQMQDRLARLAERRATPASTGRTTPKAGPARKRHAAKGSRAAALMMSVGAVAGLTGYFQSVSAASASATTATAWVGAASATTATASVVVGAVSATATQVLSTSTGATSTGSAASSAAASTTASGLADGTYTGATDTNKWGPVQVQITVSGGQITEVVAIQTPSDDSKSVTINSQATPILASEVLTAQSADIDTVSGATYTSDSYKVSLQSAIDLARSTALQATASA